MIGEFEYFVLASCQHLGEAAYGASIASHIESATGRRCSSGALYLTLDRLESKGLIKTHLGEATKERGGRAKRIVELTGEGIAAAREFHQAVTQISKRIRWEGKANAITALVLDATS